jgi:cysteine desulfurase family protein
MIYLDNAATSFPKAPGTAAAVSRFLNKVGANSGRSSHPQARESSSIIFNCREILADFFGNLNSDRIIFTSNATESLNIAILGMVMEGATVLTSSIEHNSVMRPLRFLEQTRGIKILKFRADRFGFPDLKDFHEKLKIKPDFLVFSAASNVTGVIVPFEEMSLTASREGIPVCVDGAQLAGSRKIDLTGTGIDLFAFSGHKGLLGPTGTGGLYIGEKADPAPIYFGGTGSRSSEELQPSFMPDKYESGTPNIAGIAGLLESVGYINKIGIKTITERENILSELLIKGLKEIDSLAIFSPLGEHEHTAAVSINSSRMSISELTLQLDRKEIAVRMGLHCSPATHRTIGTFEAGGTVRLSPGYFTTEKEIEKTINIIREIL